MRTLLLGLILSLVAVLVLAVSAVAEVREFKHFTVDIPPSWTADQDDDGVYIAANDGSSVLSIMMGRLEKGITLPKAARELAERYRAIGPKELGGGEAFTFTYRDPTTGHPAVALITAVGDSFMYISQIGDNDEADLIISSMKARPK